MEMFITKTNRVITPGYGYLVDMNEITIATLFGAQDIIEITYFDLFRDTIQIAPLSGMKQVPKLPQYEHLYSKHMETIGSKTLVMLNNIKLNFNLTGTQAEFVLLAYYLNKGDKAAIVAHKLWQEYVDSTSSVMDDDLSLDEMHRDQLRYLTNEDIEALIGSKFFISLDKNKFKLNKALFEKDLFINDQIAYEQFNRLFADCKIGVRGSTYAVCNIVNRKEAVEDYWNAIEGSIEKHKRVLEACEYAIDNNLVVTGLNKILANREFDNWIALIDDDSDESETWVDDCQTVNII